MQKTEDASGINLFYFKDNKNFTYDVYDTDLNVIGFIGSLGSPTLFRIDVAYMKRYRCVLDLESAPDYPDYIQWIRSIPNNGFSVSIEFYRGLHEIPGHTDDSPIQVQLLSSQNGIDFGNFCIEKTNYVQNVRDVCGNYGLSFMSDRVGIIDLEKNEEIHNAYYAEHELLTGNKKEAFILPKGDSNGRILRVLILFDDGKAVASTDITCAEWVQTNWWEIKDTNKPIFVKEQDEITDASRQVYDPTLPEHCYINTNTDTLKDFDGETFQAFQGLRKFRGTLGNAAIERSNKMSLLGTYSLDYLTKPVVWCTTDGGHNLFNKLDFCDDVR